MESSNVCTEKYSYALPSWRVNQIIFFTVHFLSNEGYYKEGFDYQKAIQKKGIRLKAYSAFKPENLLELQKISLSLWDEGLCLVTTDNETQQDCRLIAYNDSKTSVEIMQIIFHEYGHILFEHTEQSPNAESEATLFSAIATFLMIAEQQLHIGQFISLMGGEENFFEGIREGLMEKFGTKEVA